MPKVTKPKKTQCYRRKKTNKILNRIKLEWCELDLTSKLILIIGAVLLIELITSIFIYPFKDDLSINIVFRTGLSSVMGYILGGLNAPVVKDTTSSTQVPTISNEKDSIGNTSSEYSEAGDCEPDKISLQNATNLRAIIATTVCLVCIIALFIASIFNQLDYKEGLIQIRDLISTTIGFLISKSNHKS